MRLVEKGIILVMRWFIWQKTSLNMHYVLPSRVLNIKFTLILYLLLGVVNVVGVVLEVHKEELEELVVVL